MLGPGRSRHPSLYNVPLSWLGAGSLSPFYGAAPSDSKLLGWAENEPAPRLLPSLSLLAPFLAPAGAWKSLRLVLFCSAGSGFPAAPDSGCWFYICSFI